MFEQVFLFHRFRLSGNQKSWLNLQSSCELKVAVGRDGEKIKRDVLPIAITRSAPPFYPDHLPA